MKIINAKIFPYIGVASGTTLSIFTALEKIDTDYTEENFSAFNFSRITHPTLIDRED
ncbi:hypothetical protein [Planococcus halotolerans]|uniref:hypothetical protein n=1 Tax=Planococcus halotolerans TaxID=2233542 RepID=UPI001402EAD2|nr:hypothetical protein [Planococcus halotolerans]